MVDWDLVFCNRPLVSIWCTVFNHAPYLEQCLDGFLTQITDFPFEVIIHDDCSTDRSVEIIKEYVAKYPHILKPIYETENQYSQGKDILFSIIMPRMNGEYYAFCEGDDYWIDAHKLQSQIDYMRAHPECGLCFTDFNIYYHKNGLMVSDVLKTDSENYHGEYSLEEWIVETGYVGPMTWMFRSGLFKQYELCKDERVVDQTFCWFAYFLSISKVYCLKEQTTAVYRVLNESASHSYSVEKIYMREKNLHKLQLRLAKRYKINDNITERIDKKYYSRFYKYIAMMNDREEWENALKYTSKLQTTLMYLSKSKTFRCVLKFLWKYKQISR